MTDNIERLQAINLREAAAEIERLRTANEYAYGPHGELAKCRAEIERLELHKRAQAEDIMTLGQMVGKLEAAMEVMRLSYERQAAVFDAMQPPEGDDAAAKIERLTAALVNMLDDGDETDRAQARAALEGK